MPDSKLTDLGSLAAIVPANLLLYVVDTSEAVLANKSKKLAYTLFEAYNDARYLQPADVALVATTGAYADLSGKPTLATVATSGAYGDLSGKPTLGTLAAFNDAPTDGSQYARLDGAWAVVSGGVTSVFTRTGAVVSASGDYTAAQVTNVAAGNIAAVTVQAALNELDTEKQPLDGTLTAYAALTGAANKLPYFTGADTFALADFSAFGRSLVDDADAATAIATLGVLQPPFTDTNALVKGSVDATKQLRWEVDGFTAGATRIMTPPNQDTLLAGQDFANVFTAAQTIQAPTATILPLTIKSTDDSTTNDALAIRDSANNVKLSVTPRGAIQNFEVNGTTLTLGSKPTAAAGAFSSMFLTMDQTNMSGSSGWNLLNVNLTTGGSTRSGSSRWIRFAIDNAIKYQISEVFELDHVSGTASGNGAYRYDGASSVRQSGFFRGTNAADGIGFRNRLTTDNGAGVGFRFSITTNSAYSPVTNKDATILILGNGNSPEANVFTTLADGRTTIVGDLATTNSITNMLTVGANTSGSVAAGYGAGLLFQGESSTTNAQNMARLTTEWATATHATRAARGKLTAFYTSTERTAIQWEADSVGSLITLGGNVTIQDKTDLTKQMLFSLSGLTTGTTRTVTWPDATMTVAGQDVANTFTAATNIFNNAVGIGTASLDASKFHLIGTTFPLFIVERTTALTNAALNTITVRTTSSGDIVDGFGPEIGFQIEDTAAVANNVGAFSFLRDGADDSGKFSIFTYAAGVKGAAKVTVLSTGRVGIGTGATAPSAFLHVLEDNAATAAIVNVAIIGLSSTGTPAAGFGPGLSFQGESSTTLSQNMARISALWNVATHASRVVDLVAEVNYSGGAVEVWRGRGGSSPLLSFLGATPIARPATYTLASTAGRVLPTPEAAFTGQDNAQVGSVYAKSADIITLQTRLNSVEGVLRQLIIDLASTSGYGLLVAS